MRNAVDRLDDMNEEPAADESIAPDGVIGRIDPVMSGFGRLGLSSSDVLILAFAGLLCIAFAPFFLVPSWTPRMGLVLAALPAGLLSIAIRLKRREVAALVGVAALLWAGLSSILSDTPRISLVGAIGRESSVMVFVAAIAMWSLGAELTERGRRVLVDLLLVGFGLNAIFGILQYVVRPQRGSLVLEAGRAYGLTSHPVYLGAFMAAACALVCSTWEVRRWWANWAFLGVFAVGVGVSGSRIALLSAVALATYALWPGGWRRVATAIGLLAIGNGVAVAVGRLTTNAESVAGEAAGLGGESVLDRVPTTASGLAHRLDLWEYGVRSVLEHPVFGTGAGGFRSAVQARFSPEFTRLHVRDDSAPWFDAHNVVVEVAVAVGIIGLLLFGAFAVSVSFRARGPLAIAAAAIVFTWSVEPAALSTLPLVCLLIGASGTSDAVFRANSQLVRQLGAGAVGVGVVVAAVFLAAELRLKVAVDSGRPERIEPAAGAFWRDPVAQDLVAQAWANDAANDPASITRSLDAAQHVVALESNRPRWWDALAIRQLQAGDTDRAIESFKMAVELQPWRLDSWRFLLALAQATDDAALEQRAMAAVCELQLQECTVEP